MDQGGKWYIYQDIKEIRHQDVKIYQPGKKTSNCTTTKDIQGPGFWLTKLLFLGFSNFNSK